VILCLALAFAPRLNNLRTGELEITMLKSFCAAASLRALVKSDTCPDIVKSCAPILEECYGLDQRGTLMDDIRTLDSTLNEHALASEVPWEYNHKDFDRLETAVHDALTSFSHTHHMDGWTAGTHAVLHKQYKIKGVQFAELHAGGKNTGGRNSIIFFQPEPDTPLVPGIIRKIFSMPRKQGNIETQAVFLAIHRYKSLSASDGVVDPFALYESFGAGLWSDELGPVEIIMPSQKICHGIMRRWMQGVCVLRAIDRVRHFVLQ
jgi:hypothetical protein